MKRILTLIILATLCVCFLFGCNKPTVGGEGSFNPSGDQSVSTGGSGEQTPPTELPPEDVLTPDKYTSEQNLTFLSSVFATKTNYRSVTEGTVTASVFGLPFNQTVYNQKNCNNGTLLTLACSKSKLVSIAEEKYFAPSAVLLRKQTSGSKIDGENTVWENGDPTSISYGEYSASYGLVPSGISDYVLNGESILSAQPVSERNGIYTLVLSLDPELSTTYYKRQVSTMAGASEHPTFESVAVSFSFNGEWELTCTSVKEVYEISILGGVKCTASMTVKYSYGEFDCPQIDYYKQFLN